MSTQKDIYKKMLTHFHNGLTLNESCDKLNISINKYYNACNRVDKYSAWNKKSKLVPRKSSFKKTPQKTSIKLKSKTSKKSNLVPKTKRSIKTNKQTGGENSNVTPVHNVMDNFRKVMRDAIVSGATPIDLINEIIQQNITSQTGGNAPIQTNTIDTQESDEQISIINDTVDSEQMSELELSNIITNNVTDHQPEKPSKKIYHEQYGGAYIVSIDDIFGYNDIDTECKNEFNNILRACGAKDGCALFK